MDGTIFEGAALDRRKHERTPAGLASTLRGGNVPAINVEILDLSREGFRVSTGAVLRLGLMIGLGIPGLGLVRGCIIRREGGTYGGKFSVPLTDREIADAFVAEPVVWAKFGSLKRALPQADATGAAA